MTGVTGKSTAVIRNNNIDTLITILPAGEKAVAAVRASKAHREARLRPIYSALLEVFYSYDGNSTRYARVDEATRTVAVRVPVRQLQPARHQRDAAGALLDRVRSVRPNPD